MDGWSILDHIFNVCRTVTDVLHIFSYLLLATFAVLVAAHRVRSTTYAKYVYDPFVNYLVKKKYAIWVKSRPHGRSIPRIIKLTIWSSSSNRLPYKAKIIKMLEDFINRF